MKLFICFTVLVAFSHCKSSPASEAKVHIEGHYINQSENEFSKAFDTIAISAYDPKAATYTIIRKTGFYRIADSIIQQKQYRIEKSIGVFDEEHLQMQEQKKGIIYSFASSGTDLILGSTRYTKIK